MMLNIQKHLKNIPINLCFGDKLRMTNVVKSKLLGACKVNIIFRPPSKKKNLTCTIFFFSIFVELFTEHARYAYQSK